MLGKLGKRDRQSVIQANGNAGEDLVKGLLGSYFTILKPNIDRDGVDIQLEPRPEGPHDLRRRETSPLEYAVIQAKYFEPGRSVRLDPEQAVEEGQLRPHYFVMLHTRAKNGDPVGYFLSSADVMSLPDGRKRNFKRFSITKNDAKQGFQLSTDAIVQMITNGMKAFAAQYYARFTQKAWGEVESFFASRSAVRAREPQTEYHLINVDLKKRKDIKGFCEAKAVFARSPAEATARAIDARWDLVGTPESTWAWGYSGSGPRLLAISILSHYLGRKVIRPSFAEAEALTYSIISKLDENEDHVITGEMIDLLRNALRMYAND